MKEYIIEAKKLLTDNLENSNISTNSLEVGRNMFSTYPLEKDIREIMDSDFQVELINKGFRYISAESNTEKLVISRYTIHPFEYSDIRNGLKEILRYCRIDPSCIDEATTLYYDETNNVKKFRLNEEQNKFNVPADTIFVLGGIVSKDSIDIKELRELLELQANAKELKSYHIYGGDLADCMKSAKLEIVIDLLISRQWYVHFSSLNLLYWSIVDILDSINDFEKLAPEIQNNLKAMLYKVFKSDLNSFFDIVLGYRYPNLKRSDIEPFMNELIDKCQNFSLDASNPYLPHLLQMLINLFVLASKQEDAVFIQDEEELLLLKELSYIYRQEVATWEKCQLVFDNETDIIFALKSIPVSINRVIMTNYSFVDSTGNPMVQLSDVVVGIVSKYLTFIDKEGLNLENTVSKTFNDMQKRVFVKLNKLLKMSRDHNPAFLHQTTSIEYHSLLNKYIDIYAL